MACPAEIVKFEYITLKNFLATLRLNHNIALII